MLPLFPSSALNSCWEIYLTVEFMKHIMCCSFSENSSEVLTRLSGSGMFLHVHRPPPCMIHHLVTGATVARWSVRQPVPFNIQHFQSASQLASVSAREKNSLRRADIVAFCIPPRFHFAGKTNFAVDYTQVSENCIRHIYRCAVLSTFANSSIIYERAETMVVALSVCLGCGFFLCQGL
jgi:hypothetical protein